MERRSKFCVSAFTARSLLLAGALFTASLRTSPAGEAAASKEDEKPKVTLSPEKEAKLAELLKKGTEAKRKVWGTQMEKEIARVRETTGLGAEAAKALGPVAEQAAEACMAGWKTVFGDGWRVFFKEQADEGFEMDQVMSQLDESVQMDWYGEYVRPYEHPKWKEGLQRVLSAEQFAAWERAENDRKAAVAKEGATVIKTMVDRTREQQRMTLQSKVTAMESALALSPERVKKLNALAVTTASATTDSLRKRGERMLLAMDDEQRRAVLKTREFYFGLEPVDFTAQQKAWKSGVAALLSPEELKKLDNANEDFASKRAAVLGKIMLTEMDERIAFTASQRESLQTIAERLVRTQKDFFADNAEEGFYRLSLQSFFAAASKANEEEMKKILDARQWTHWQEACGAKEDPGYGRVRVVSKKPPSTPDLKLARAAEPEDLENAVSDHFHDKTTAERTRLLRINLLKVEDAARAAGLAAEAVSRLETAARGSTEELLVAWKQGTENTIRGQVRDATPENVKQRLAGMENYTYGHSGSTASTPVWEKTMKSEMTDAARAAWKKELDARTAYHDAAITALLMVEFERKIPLRSEQRAKLEPIIAAKMKEYAPDIGMMFSSSYSWFLQSYTMFLPFAAVPEKELKEILGKDAWERWVQSPENGNLSSYWENVQNNHERRTKEKRR